VVVNDTGIVIYIGLFKRYLPTPPYVFVVPKYGSERPMGGMIIGASGICNIIPDLIVPDANGFLGGFISDTVSMVPFAFAVNLADIKYVL